MVATGGGCRNLFLFFSNVQEFEGCPSLSWFPRNAENVDPVRFVFVVVVDISIVL